MTLVQFLAQTKQMEKAEQAVRDAEVALRTSRPSALPGAVRRWDSLQADRPRRSEDQDLV
jgi:hypothetical protein